MNAQCTSRLATRTEHDNPYWPTCDRDEGHDGSHLHGHPQDVMWVWTDADAMTPEQVAACEAGAAVTDFRLCGITIPADVARTAQDGQTVFEPNGSPVRRWRTETAKTLPSFNSPRPDLKDAS